MKPDERFAELWTDYLEGELNDAGHEELRRLLAEHEPLRRRAGDLYQAHRLLGFAAQEDAAGAESFVRMTMAQLPRSRESFVSGLMGQLGRAKAAARPRRAWLFPALSWGAAAMLLLGGWVACRPVVGLEAIRGSVTVLRGGRAIPGAELLALVAGDVVRTTAGAGARVRWHHEATHLDLQENTEVRLTSVRGGKRLRLLSGTLTAEVAKQAPNNPMALETRDGLVEVLGTRFELSASTKRTRVEVASGRVFLRPVNHDNGYVVEACQSGEMDEAGEVAVVTLPTVESIAMGLLAHWPLNEGSGTIARDVSGHGRDAVIQAPFWSTNEGHAVLIFVGAPSQAPDQRQAVRTPELPLPSLFTITFWVQPHRSESRGDRVQALVANARFGREADGFYFLINRLLPKMLPRPVSSDDQSLNFRAGDGRRNSEALSPPQSLALDAWSFVALKVNQTMGRVDIQVNGQTVCSQSPIAREFSLGTPLWFGAAPGPFGLPLNGMLRDIRIYERLLEADEVSRLQRAGQRVSGAAPLEAKL
ncbi:MAG: FecR domain-containing protein [Verrucomicrobia bacterium]|nr:FecR domain-containing protein [Verrucomicrobiota bacterium]